MLLISVLSSVIVVSEMVLILRFEFMLLLTLLIVLLLVLLVLLLSSCVKELVEMLSMLLFNWKLCKKCNKFKALFWWLLMLL